MDNRAGHETQATAMKGTNKILILWAKALCYLTIGVFTPWAAALAQWVNSGEWPSRIIWFGVILPASAVGGASQLLAFLSSSFSKYQNDRDQKEKEETAFLRKVTPTTQP